MKRNEFEKLVAEVRPRLLKIAARVAGPSYADDAVQEAVADVWRNRGGAAQIKRYLKIATKNAAKDIARSEERQMDQIERHVTEYGRPIIVEDVESLEKKIDVRRALAQLPEDIRAAVWAVYAEGASWQDVADELGTPRKTLFDRVQKALPFLREQLGRQDPPSAASH
jgi:RNA polymerase sigma factor (sigma-70 family)